jgi:hypothetical protein
VLLEQHGPVGGGDAVVSRRPIVPFAYVASVVVSTSVPSTNVRNVEPATSVLTR